MKYSSYLSTSLLLLVTACAKVGAPSGGPKDINPPVVENAEPAHLQTNIHPTEIRIQFDEFIQLNQARKNIIINPYPGAYEATTQGRELRIELSEQLKEDQTYSVQLIDAVKDNNESNMLPFTVLAFSTGNKIDSAQITVRSKLSVSGKETEVKILIDKNISSLDSFRIDSFIYRTKSKDDKEVQLSFIKPDTYRLIAYQDLNDNDIYEINEPLGVSILDIHDSSYAEIALSKPRTPLSKYKVLSHGYQPAKSRLFFEFNETIDSFYQLDINLSINALQWPKKSAPIYTLSHSRDSLFVYIPATSPDTIKTSIALGDSVFTFLDGILPADSIPWSYSVTQVQKNNAFNLSLRSQTPLVSTNSVFATIINATDSNQINADSIILSNPFELQIYAPFKTGKKYLLLMEEGFIRSPLPMSFRPVDSLSFSFSSENYQSIHILPEFPECTHPIFYIHSSDGKILQSNKNYNNLVFKNLRPGSYFISCLDDLNNNGLYDPIVLNPFTQAEPIYHALQTIELKEGWDLENHPLKIR